MGCVSAHISVEPFVAGIRARDISLHPAVSISVDTPRSEVRAGAVSPSRLGIGIVHPVCRMRCSQICDVNIGDYVKVDKKVVWVTPDIWEQIMIRSNTDWIII